MRRQHIDLPEGLELNRLVRGTDPETSLLAAAKAAKASSRAIGEVVRVMMDCRARIDEEIWEDCRKNGYYVTQDTIIHARLALGEAGLLLLTGGTKNTINNLPS